MITLLLPWWALAAAPVLFIALGWFTAYAHLTGLRDRIGAEKADVVRLTTWTPPTEPREPGREPWPQPLSPRDHEVELARRDRERVVALAERAALSALPPAPEVDADPAPVDAERPTLRQRAGKVLRPYLTDALVWLAMHEPAWWTDHDLPARVLDHEGRHRASEPDEESTPEKSESESDEPAWNIPTGEIDRGLTAILEAGIYAGVVRGAR